MFDIVLKIFLWGKLKGLAVWYCIFFEFMLLFWFTKYWIWSGILFSSTRSTKCFTALAAEISNPNWYTRTVRIFKIRFSRCMLYRHNAAIGTDGKLFFWGDNSLYYTEFNWVKVKLRMNYIKHGIESVYVIVSRWHRF